MISIAVERSEQDDLNISFQLLARGNQVENILTSQ